MTPGLSAFPLPSSPITPLLSPRHSQGRFANRPRNNPSLYLDQHGVALAAAGADGREAFAASPAPQLVEERGQYARSGSPDGMAEREGAAVDVDYVGVHAEDAGGVDRHPRERLVYLHEVQVVGAPPGLLQRELPRVAWHGKQVRRLLRDLGVRDDGSEGLQAASCGKQLAREHQGAGPVGDAGRVAGGHGAAFVYGLQGGQLFDGRVTPYRLVGLDVVCMSPLAGNFDAYYLLGEFSVVGRGGGALVAAERPLVLLVAGDIEFLRPVGAEPDHVYMLEGVEESVVHHGVDRRRVAHARAPAGVR